VAENCLFCKIVAGEIPSVKIYENEDVIAFMDIMPVTAGHCLIVPKLHSESLLDAKADTIAAVAAASIPIANAVKQATKADGIKVAQFNGAAAGQTVYHYHMHIIPCFEGESVGSHGRDAMPLAELQKMADLIKEFLEQ